MEKKVKLDGSAASLSEAVWPFGVYDEYDPGPMSPEDRKRWLEIWESCKPKLDPNIDYGVVYFSGTGGEIK